METENKLGKIALTTGAFALSVGSVVGAGFLTYYGLADLDLENIKESTDFFRSAALLGPLAFTSVVGFKTGTTKLNEILEGDYSINNSSKYEFDY